MDISHLVYTFINGCPSTGGHMSCFYLLAIVKNAAMNIHVQVFVYTYAFNSLGYVPGSGTAGP